MGIIKLPKKFHTDFSNPRTKPIGDVKVDKEHTPAGLVEYYLMNGTRMGLLGNELVSGNSAFTFPAVSARHGKEIRVVDTGASSDINAGDVVQPSSACSMFFGFYSNTTITTGDRTFANDAAASIISRNNASGNAEFLINSLTNDRVSHSWSPQVGELVVLGGSWGGDGTPLKVYSKTQADGVKITTNGATSSGTYSISNNILNPLSTLDGGFIFAIFFDKQVTDVEARRIMNSPYSLLVPKVAQVYFPVNATGALDITPTGIASTEAFGTGVVTTGAVDIAANGIPSSEAFGTAVISQATFITPSGIASTEAFGTADVSQATFVTPTGIASAEAFGTAVITTGAVTLSPTGISSAEAFGSHTVGVVGAKDIKIDFQDEIVMSTNLQSTTLYFNGVNYFTVD